jgi:hypothetical protein
VLRLSRIGLDHGRWIDPRNTKKVVPKPNSMLQGCLYRRCEPRHIESLGFKIAVDHCAAAAVGHTDAGHDQTRAAISAGARVASRLFNAMRPIHHTGSRADHHAAG